MLESYTSQVNDVGIIWIHHLTAKFTTINQLGYLSQAVLKSYIAPSLVAMSQL